MTLNDQWHRISFRKGELVSGTMGRFFLDSLLPATEELGRNKTIDLRTVAVFGVDDSEGGRYAVYFSPGAFSELRPAVFTAPLETKQAAPSEIDGPQPSVQFE